MIFVTVGTHEQPFNRLLQELDKLKSEGAIDEDIFIQTGYSTYVPQHCEWSKMLAYKDMKQKINDAHIVITHGGPASFIMPLQVGKIPIVVPRKFEFNEHVNDHQVDFVHAVAARMHNIVPVYEISDLGEAIRNYDRVVSTMSVDVQSNNAVFNQRLEEIVQGLL